MNRYFMKDHLTQLLVEPDIIIANFNCEDFYIYKIIMHISTVNPQLFQGKVKVLSLSTIFNSLFLKHAISNNA